MHILGSLLAGAVVIASVVAQSTRIAFTSVPAMVVAGEYYNITWAGGDGTSTVTLTLRKGDPSNLDTVGIIGDGITADFFVWNVSPLLTTADDYALQITQGQSEINYSGLFSVEKGTEMSNNSSSVMTSATASSNSSLPMLSTTPSASIATSTALSRNTTFSTASISQASTTISADGATGIAASGSDSTSSTSSPSASPSATQSTSTPNSNTGVSQLGSSVALVMGLFAAIMFFG